MSKLNDVFANARKKNKSVLIGFITGGDPSPETCVKIAKELVKQGVDIIELGIPFSDPIADGPTIQRASMRALEGGTSLKSVINMISEIREELKDLPLIIMTYYNPILAMGIDIFVKESSLAGVDAVIVLDLSFSMLAEDIVPTRLQKAKDVIRDFIIRKRPEDRIALVSFSA